MRTFAFCVVLAAAAFAQDLGKAAPHVTAGQQKLQAGDFKGAEAEFAKAIEAEPGLAVPHLLRGVARMNLGENEKAVADLSKALEIDSKVRGGYTLRAQARQAAHDYAGALEDYDKAIEQGPNHNLHMQRGQLRETTGDLDGAIEDYGATTAFAAQWAAPWERRAHARFVKGDLEGAHEDLELALYCAETDAENYAQVLMERARLYVWEDKQEEAKRDVGKALESAPESAQVLFLAGRLHHDMGDFAKAAAELEKSVRLDPEQGHEYTRLYLCLAHGRAGDLAKGQQELAKYLSDREEKEDWFVQVAGFLCGRLAEKDFLAAARTEKPDQTREQECEAYWYAGAMRLIQGDRETARTYLEKCRATGVTLFIEYASAGLELRRLTKQPGTG